MKSMLAATLTTGGMFLGTQVALATQYGASNLGGSTYLTWGFTSPYKGEPSRSTVRRDRVVIGYACVTRNTLGAMTRDAFMHRYAITAIPHTGDMDLKPLQAIQLVPNGSRLTTQEIEPFPTHTIWQRTQRNYSGEWFASDGEPDELGKACVEGGITAGSKYLQGYFSSLRSNGNVKPSSTSTEAILTSQNPKSPINIRDAAGTSSSARHIGYAGDRVIILSSQIGNDGYKWYQIRFNVSGATGWVREDFVRR